jgi:pSer/pThr/pTyr-binding forkhead associated (FHA) protein
MAGYLQIFGPRGTELIPLETDRLTLGKDPSNDVVLDADPTVSRLHAVLERFPAGWTLRDLTSRNGTFVNRERVLSECRLRAGDEIRLGATRLTFRSDELLDPVATEAAVGAPELTRRERDVLVALCRPVFSGDVFTEPASLKEMAAALFVSEAAVKQHLVNLYDKFGLYDGGERRRVRLANEAIRRGAVSLADLRADSGGESPR